MRLPTYLSYSAFSLFEGDREEFYIKHLAETRAPRLPQERPASVGSAFDAYVKADLHEKLFGAGADPKYAFEALFETQVEAHHRDWAREEGKYVFECYKLTGMFDTLLALLQKGDEPPRFEFEVRAKVVGVPFLGKPDCRFVVHAVHVIHDWKVNGYCSQYAASPNKGFMLCMDGYVGDKQSRSHGTTHKQFVPMTFNGLTIDSGHLEDCSTAWADQLSLYGWALGEKVGDSKVVLSVDQIVAKPIPSGRPLLRAASYRARVRQSYQEFLAQRFKTAWEVISSGYIFRDLTEEESAMRCKMLEEQSVALQSDGSQLEDWFNEAVRPKYRG